VAAFDEVLQCAGGHRFLKDNRVDLIFLDINMPLLSGMELAGLLSEETAIVFTTAHFEHAVESYSFNTIDYLLKPITLRRFLAATKKVETYFRPRMPVTDKEEKSGNEYFFVKSGTELRKILLPEILFFRKPERIRARRHPNLRGIDVPAVKGYRAQLSMPFARVHNSYIVNIRQMNKIQDNHIHIGDIQIPIGEKFRDGLMEMIRKKTF
jgi:two-component system LytT family response regulator